MLRWIFGLAFFRWGLPGLLVAFLFLIVVSWILLSAVWWLVEGVFFGMGILSALGYAVLLIAVIRWMRNRRSQEHLLEYGRRRWLE